MIAKFEASRRRVLTGGLTAGLVPLFGSAAAALETACGFEPQLRVMSPRPQRAISLRGLVGAVLAGKPPRLEGMTRLDGYVTDAESHDIILWGLSEPDQPELHFDDFLVALRAAHQRYFEVRDGGRYLGTPAISIDPDLDVFRELEKIGVFDPARKKKHEEICRRPQRVRVEGMPRHTRVAKVLVDADYRMKMVSQGAIQLPISSPFPGTHTVRISKWRRAALEGNGSGPGKRTRYWFEPGRFTYQVSDNGDTVFLDCAQVVLHDEDQRLKEDAASGKVDPDSRAFACSWTTRMEDTYRAEPIWRDMHNMFRHFAIARIMADRGALAEVAFADEALLLDRYKVAKVDVPSTLPGLGRWEEFEKTGKGTSFHRFTYWVCGGVVVGFARPLDPNKDAGETRVSGRTVLAARPDTTVTSWAVNPSSLKGIFHQPAAPKPAPERKSPGSLRDLFKT